MGLASGTKLGPYEIQSPLGAGGMGEVYRARDTRLDRTVAIKILPSHLSENAEAKQRFDREARTISSLNHPNICTLHDVGRQDGVDYLVMEYLEGETLADRLRKGPLPVAQVLKYGVEICDGLEKAHRSGVTHRDLKPGNIMLTKTGAKLMDFGLAKALVARADATSGLTVTMTTPVGSHPLTAQGTVVGTFQYMAPEQVEGKEADARSDIFALGAVLYEMATAKRAFEGKTAASAMAAVLEREPAPISSVQPMSPAGLDHVVQGCLAKDPEARWQSAADIARELRWIASGGSGVGVAPPVKIGPRWREHMIWAAVAAVLLVALAWSTLRGHEPERTLRSFLPPPAQMSFDFTGDFSGPPAISADGTAVAFCARTQRERDVIWVQSLGDLAPKKIDGTEGASFPFWSADGKFLGFFADSHLKKVPAAGGPVTILAEAPNPRGGSWNQDNVIIYEPDYRDTLWRISAAGGSPVRLTKFENDKHTTHRWPQFLPDGKHFLFFATNHSGDSEHGIYFGSLADGTYKHVLDADSGGQYASGYLIYHLQSQLQAQKFDDATGTVSGEPVTLANLVEYDTGTWHTTFTASQNGLLVYEPGSKTLGTDVVWMDRSGKTLSKVAERAFYKGAGRISPDGKRLAISMGDPQADIWVLDLASRIANPADVWRRHAPGAFVVGGWPAGLLHEAERHHGDDGDFAARAGGQRRRAGRSIDGDESLHARYSALAAVVARRPLPRPLGTKRTDGRGRLGVALDGREETIPHRAAAGSSIESGPVPPVSRRPLAGVQFDGVGAGGSVRHPFSQRTGPVAGLAKWRHVSCVARG